MIIIIDIDLENLVVLEYSGNNQSGQIENLEGLDKARNLKTLRLPSQKLTSLEPLENLSLTAVDFSANARKLSVVPLKYHLQLTHIKLNDTELETSSLIDLPSNVDSLELGNTKVKQFDFLHYLWSLRRLNLQNNNLTVEDAENFLRLAVTTLYDYVDLSHNHLYTLEAFTLQRDISLIEGETNDFHSNQGWNLANQTYQMNHRLTAGKSVKITNPVKSPILTFITPLKEAEDDFSYDPEKGELAWDIQLSNEGELETIAKVFSYGNYQSSNFSLTLTVALNYEPIKITLPLRMSFEREGMNQITSEKYKVSNHSSFGTNLILHQVIEDPSNTLKLSAQPIASDFISMYLQTSLSETNVIEEGAMISKLAQDESLEISLKGTFQLTEPKNHQLNYQFVFHFEAAK